MANPTLRSSSSQGRDSFEAIDVELRDLPPSAQIETADALKRNQGTGLKKRVAALAGMTVIRVGARARKSYCDRRFVCLFLQQELLHEYDPCVELQVLGKPWPTSFAIRNQTGTAQRSFRPFAAIHLPERGIVLARYYERRLRDLLPAVHRRDGFHKLADPWVALEANSTDGRSGRHRLVPEAHFFDQEERSGRE